MTPPPQPTGWPEPAIIVSMVTALITAVLGVAIAFGLDISDEQRDAVLYSISPCVAVIFAVGFFIRQMVTPVGKAEARIDEAFVAGQTGGDKPDL